MEIDAKKMISFLHEELGQIARDASTTLDEIAESLQKRNKTGSMAEKPEKMRRYTKMAWNYEEKFCQFYTMEDAIKWVKAHLPPEAKGACIFKKMEKDNTIVLHHCYLSATAKPMLNGKFVHRIVHTLEISKQMEAQFNGKDLLVLR